MRVFIDGRQAGNRSGTGRYTEQLIYALAAEAADIDLVVAWPDHVVRTGLPNNITIVRRDRGPLGRFVAPAERGEEVAGGPCDVCHFPANFGWGGARTVVTVHDVSFLRNPKWFRWERAAYYRWAIKKTVRGCGRVIADSQATANDLQSFLACSPDRIDVVPLGVSKKFRPVGAEGIATARRRHALPERYLLYAGTIEPRKNLPRLVAAWSQVAREISADLVIAGRVGWKARRLLRAVTQSPMSTRIHLPGFVPDADLPGMLSGALAFVWPSLYEGFGLPPLEAMACGAPVITSNSASIPEVAGNAALLVDPTDTGALSEAIRTVASDENLRAQLAKAGRARAAEFTWQRTARMTADVYRKLAAET